jgi:hypothetical protein
VIEGTATEKITARCPSHKSQPAPPLHYQFERLPAQFPSLAGLLFVLNDLRLTADGQEDRQTIA